MEIILTTTTCYKNGPRMPFSIEQLHIALLHS